MSAPTYIPLAEAAKYSGFSALTIRRRITDGLIRSVLCSSRRLVHKQDLIAWIEGSPPSMPGMSEHAARASAAASVTRASVKGKQ